MRVITRRQSVRPREDSRPGTGRQASAGSLVSLIAPTSARMVLGVQALGVLLIAGYLLVRVMSGRTVALSPISPMLSYVGLLAAVTVLVGLLRSAGCWGILRGSIDAGASRRVVRLAALGVLGLLVVLQLPAGIILAIILARTPDVIVSTPGGAVGILLDYAVTCLAVDVLGMLGRAVWRGRLTWGTAALLVALIVGTPSALGDQGVLGILQWFLPSAELLTIPAGSGLAHLGWALLVGPGALTWLLARWEPRG